MTSNYNNSLISIASLLDGQYNTQFGQQTTANQKLITDGNEYISSEITGNQGFYQGVDSEVLNNVSFLNTNSLSNFTDIVNNARNYVSPIVGSTTTIVDYSNFSAYSLTTDQMTNDNLFQNILAYMPVVGPPSGVSYSYLSNWYNWFVLNILDMLNIYSAPFYIIQFNDWNTCLNLACRIHVFDFTQGVLPVISLVDVETGVEMYRVLNYTDSADLNNQDNNPALLRNIKRVINGIVSTDSANLSLSEIIKITSALPAFVLGYTPFTLYYEQQASIYKQLISQYGPVNAAAHYTIDTQLFANLNNETIAYPFADGSSGNILFTSPRLLAINKKTPDNNYIFGWNFLPFNNFTYSIWDTSKVNFIQPSPYTLQNFTTILKLIGIGWLTLECIVLIFHTKYFGNVINTAENDVLSLHAPKLEFY